jgi:hypothetical protein
MRLIKLTSLLDKQPIYINVDTIGHFYEVKEEIKHGRVEKAKHTRVGALTHNNGGFSVIEDVNKILKLIEESRGI